MNTQLTNLKTELSEFIELSKTITNKPWIPDKSGCSNGGVGFDFIDSGDFAASNAEMSIEDATFIARSRNISPAMAECLLVAVEALENIYESSFYGKSSTGYTALQQILNIWEAAK